MGRFVVQSFPGSVIEPMYGASDLPALDGGEVTLLGEVLACKPIGVLVKPAFPGSIRMGEEEVGIEGVGDGLDGVRRYMLTMTDVHSRFSLAIGTVSHG